VIVLDGAGAALALGARLAAVARPGDVVLLSGPLGAGKTTLARGVLRGLGWTGDVPSPSFALVESYDAPPLRLAAWHVDLYRLDDARDAPALGLDDAERGLLLIEWPERLSEGAFPGALRLRLEAAADERRRLTADVPPAWAGRWPPPA
jgi:tRNA threonylcarbamoyladenosine biosynthesis protein TsaE